LLLAVLIEIVTVYSVYKNQATWETNIWLVAFAQFSVFALLVFIVIMMSGLKKTGENHKTQKELLEVTLSSIGDAVIATDVNGTVNFLNPAAETLTGWPAADAAGKPLTEVFSRINEETGKPVTPAILVPEAERQWPLGKESILITRHREEIPVEYSSAPIQDPKGAVIGAISVFHDISGRRLAEQALMESESRLQQSQKLEAIGTLTGGVAHDFNNLLTAILGNVQLGLRKIEPADPVQVNLVEIEKAGNRAAGLTRQLLAFSRRQHLNRSSINLNDSIAEIFKLIERVIGADINISADYDDELWAAYADNAQIEQVIMNLSINARDAMPYGGRLKIETSNIELDEHYSRHYPYVLPGKYVQIKVSDTGSGMDEETKARIFEPFFTTKETSKGTGLGLAMVYGIVKQHEGHINVYSELGHGTTFKIFLPATAAAAHKENAAMQPVLLEGNETILIAEDEESLQNLSRDILESLGYKVLMAKNGEEAVEIFSKNRDLVDLLLLDVVMPIVGGAEAYDRICKVAGRDIPLIFMTGYSSEIVTSGFEKDGRSEAARNANVIQKPYSLDALGHKIREVLDSVVKRSRAS
jgi:PAS domain S-box-containing protein